tara:strand:- start:397 stop:1422 length:1026 start_codon:yes stop_codon:yes gene_type:complete
VRLLITGGCGFLGSNLALEALGRDMEVFILDNLSREGSKNNLSWLKSLGEVKYYEADIRDFNKVEQIFKEVKPDVVFHLAGQVAMTTSLTDPIKDFEINVLGTLNVLEAIKKIDSDVATIYSSTNKVYGDLEQFDYVEKKTRYEVVGKEQGFDEQCTLDFRSPYGCSKGAADQYMLDYSRNYGLKNIVFRHSSIFGGRQFSTFDQGWVGWFVKKALIKKSNRNEPEFEIFGNGKQVRDVLFSSDLINCYFSAFENIEKCSGQAFNIGGGMINSLSLIELFGFLENTLKVKLNFIKKDWRSNDQRVFVADTKKAKTLFHWEPQVKRDDGLRQMIEWVDSYEL